MVKKSEYLRFNITNNFILGCKRSYVANRRTKPKRARSYQTMPNQAGTIFTGSASFGLTRFDLIRCAHQIEPNRTDSNKRLGSVLCNERTTMSINYDLPVGWQCQAFSQFFNSLLGANF